MQKRKQKRPESRLPHFHGSLPMDVEVLLVKHTLALFVSQVEVGTQTLMRKAELQSNLATYVSEIR